MPTHTHYRPRRRQVTRILAAFRARQECDWIRATASEVRAHFGAVVRSQNRRPRVAC